MRSSYIYSGLSKVLGVLLSSLKLLVSFFMKVISLYSLLLFDHSLPLVDYVDDLLDACPIRALLETLCVVVRLNTTVRRHFHINAASWIGAEHLL